MKSCFFIGHRGASADVYPALERAVEQHIAEYGVTGFVVGNHGEFDRLAAKAVIAAKARYPHITLTMLLPYQPEACTVTPPAEFDNIFYPPGMELVQRRFAISRANRYMVDHVHYLIACIGRSTSNIKELVEYAKMREASRLITVTQL